MPVFNVVKADVEVVLASPVEVKNRKGHKTDAQDSWWLAHLLRHGMIRPSFIPEKATRDLRELMRRRKKLVDMGRRNGTVCRSSRSKGGAPLRLNMRASNLGSGTGGGSSFGARDLLGALTGGRVWRDQAQRVERKSAAACHSAPYPSLRRLGCWLPAEKLTPLKE